MSQTHHLQKRGNTWHFIRRVPSHLVPVIGKTMIKKSLATPDLKVAKVRRSAVELAVDALFEAAEAALAAPGPPKSQPVTLAMLTEHLRAHIASTDEKSVARLLADPPDDEAQKVEMKADAEYELQILKNRDDPRGDQWIDSTARNAVAASGTSVTDPEMFEGFAEVVRRGLIELQRRKIDRYEDLHGRVFHDPLFDPSRPANVTFGELREIFIAERLKDYAANGVREKSADRIKAATTFLVELIGAGTLVHIIDDDTIQSARERIAVIPSNRQKVYPGLSLNKQIEKAAKDGRSLLSANTQNFYTDTLRDMLKVAARKKLIRFNPAEDVRPLKRETLAPEEKRLPFSPEQLSGFFRGGFYRSCVPGAEQPYTEGNKPWRFWLPLIMLFSGARPGEILQLSIKDVKRTAAGTWFFDLMNVDGTKALKTSTSRRRVPIHSELIHLGFLEFVDKRKQAAKSKDVRLFSGIKPDKYGGLTDVPSKGFNRTFLRAEIKLEARQALYSLRHNVRDALRRCKAPPEALRHIAGWSAGKDVSDHYGDPGNPDLMAEWVEKISYPDLDLTFLHGAGGSV